MRTEARCAAWRCDSGPPVRNGMPATFGTLRITKRADGASPRSAAHEPVEVVTERSHLLVDVAGRRRRRRRRFRARW